MAENEGTLDKVYEDLKQLRDEIALKVHLGSMELRDEWRGLERDWDTWTHQLQQGLEETGADLEERLRNAGGDDLRKLGVGGLSEGPPPWEATVSQTSSQLLLETYRSMDQLIREATFLKTSFDSIGKYPRSP